MGSNGMVTAAAQDVPVPHPVRRALVAVALGAALGALSVLTHPRPAVECRTGHET